MPPETDVIIIGAGAPVCRWLKYCPDLAKRTSCTWNDDGNVAKVGASVMGLNTAAVFVGGRHGVWSEGRAHSCHDFAVDRVADIFVHDIREHVERCIATAWSTQPWARGAWRCVLPVQAPMRQSGALCR